MPTVGEVINPPETSYQDACRLLASADANGRERARELFAQGAATGHLPSLFRLGELHLQDADPDLRARGIALIRQAADAGHPRATFLLGLLHAQGRNGVAQDPAAAAALCSKAARDGLGVAQFNLGLLYAEGRGLAADPLQAARWLRRAALNGVTEGDGCLDLIYRDDTRPRTWQEAETRASVALDQTDPDIPKTLRFAEYYIDPCLDLVAQQFALRRDEIEDIVQQFFLELEEPLVRGRLAGRPWKDSLRGNYRVDRGRFRPYLGRTLVNFVRTYLRDRNRVPMVATATDRPQVDQSALVERHAGEWSALLHRFAADNRNRRADATRAVDSLLAVLADDANQADLVAAHGVSERTIRNAVRLGTELLLEWLARQIGTVAGTDHALRLGLELLPSWLRHPAADKRAKTLLLLAVVERRIRGDSPAGRASRSP